MEKETDWKNIIQKFKTSGKKQLVFCKEAGIPYSTFRYHYRKLEQDKDIPIFDELSISNEHEREHKTKSKNTISIKIDFFKFKIDLQMEF